MSMGRYLGMGTHIRFLAGKKKNIALGTDCVTQERTNRNKYSFWKLQHGVELGKKKKKKRQS